MPRTVEQVDADIARLTALMVSGVSQSSVGDMTTKWDTTALKGALQQLQAERADLIGRPLMTRMSFARIVMRRF